MNSDFEPDQGRRRTLVTSGTLLAGLLGTQAARAGQAAASQAADGGTGNTLPVSEPAPSPT